MSEARDKALDDYLASKTWNNPEAAAEQFLAIYDQVFAAAAQAVSLPDRETLAEALSQVFEMGTLPNFLNEADAVLAALSTQPDGYCTCDGEMRMGDCGIAEHRAEATGLSTQPAAGDDDIADDMVERAARGLYGASKHRVGWVGWQTWDELGVDDLVRALYVNQARAALSAALNGTSIEQTEANRG